MSGSLSCLFNVRLCNFKATGLQNASHGAPPYCVRGNFDGRAFNSEYFHSATMAPMWALDTSFEYQTGTVENLRTKFLVLECYGGDRFLGMARVDLFTIATSPQVCELAIKEGPKMNGVLAFEVSFQQVTSISIHLSRLAMRGVAGRGYEGGPNPYLSYGLSVTGNDLESAVAANADCPQWERLPPMHHRGTFQTVCNQRIHIDLKHSRNGCTPGINDPTMSTFEIALSQLPVDFGRDSAIPFREMVHSMPSYQFPFSAEASGLLEIRNTPQVVQMKGGILTDEGVVGGVPMSSGGRDSNIIDSPLKLGGAMGMTSSASVMHNNTTSHQIAAPRSPMVGGNVSQMGSAYVSPTKATPMTGGGGGAYNTSSSLLGGVSAFPPASTMMTSQSAPDTTSALMSSSHVKGQDIEMLQEVADKQQSLLNTVQDRLRQINRRRTELAIEITNHRNKEEEELELSTKRRQHIEGDSRAAMAERERLEGVLRTIALRRDQEMQNSAQLAAERERARRAVEEEQQEVNVLQERVNHLRTEMTRHLEEEELRYAQRVREAEEARRRAQRDAEDLAALEAKLVNAERRAQKSFSEGSSSGAAYRGMSPSRR